MKFKNIINENYSVGDFIKPHPLETAFMAVETFFWTFPLTMAGCHDSYFNEQFNLETKLAYGLFSIAPQLLTYAAGRAYEIFGKENYIKDSFRGGKELYSAFRNSKRKMKSLKEKH